LQRSTAASASASWRHAEAIVAPTGRSYALEFPHQVRLANAGGWRTAHTSAALRSVDPRSVRWWTERSAVDGILTFVWGFKRFEDAIWFELWATSSGIDWTVRPEAQHERPHLPADHRQLYGATPPGRGAFDRRRYLNNSRPSFL
jgi:hypothetical protein